MSVVRRLCLILLVVLSACSTSAPKSIYHDQADDSNTVNPLPVPGASSFASATNAFMANEDANRWREQGFRNFVSTVASQSSCLGAVGAGLTMTPTSCVAYNAGYRGTETGSITFTNSKTTWVAMDENTSGSNAGLPNFTRVGTTHYLTDNIDATQPAMAFDSQLLMKVVTSGGSITQVVDLRNFNTSLTAVVNVQSYGAVCDDSTDNAAAFKAAINGLPIIGGEPQGIVVVPACILPYAIKTASTTAAPEVQFPRGVSLRGANGQSATLDCSSITSGACVVYADSNAGALTQVVQGGIQDIKLLGAGIGSSMICLYLGGDPAGTISPSGDFGDEFYSHNMTTEQCGVGVQIGAQSYIHQFDDSYFYQDGKGYYAPAGAGIGVENGLFIHDSFNQCTVPYQLDNQFSRHNFISISQDYNQFAAKGNYFFADYTNPHFETCAAGNISGGSASCTTTTNANIGAFIDTDSSQVSKISIRGGDAALTGGTGSSSSMFRIGGTSSSFFFSPASVFNNSGQTVTEIVNFENGSGNAALWIDGPLDDISTATMTNSLTPWLGLHINVGTAAYGGANDQLSVRGAVSIGPTFQVNNVGSNLNVGQSANAANTVACTRATDSSPTGHCFDVYSHSMAANPFFVDVNGNVGAAGSIRGLTTASVSGGGTIATGSNSFSGTITGLASTSNVLTPGFICPNAVVATLTPTTASSVDSITASSTTTVTFSATGSTPAANYIVGCR